MTIHVTQELILHGRPRDCGNCPTHHALRPFMPVPFKVFASRVADLDGNDLFNLPQIATENIMDIDRHPFDNAKPFSFDLSAENFIYAK